MYSLSTALHTIDSEYIHVSRKASGKSREHEAGAVLIDDRIGRTAKRWLFVRMLEPLHRTHRKDRRKKALDPLLLLWSNRNMRKLRLGVAEFSVGAMSRRRSWLHQYECEQENRK